MKASDAVRSATSISARLFHLDQRVGLVKSGLMADLIAVEGDPTANISALRKIKLVMKGGKIYRE
jgi:imidazolonepropionase-like amidohydrolase